MPSPEVPLGGANTDLSRLVAAAADLCRKPLRHAVVAVSAGGEAPTPTATADLDLYLRLEARNVAGERLPQQDLELELYRSGDDLSLTLAWRLGEEKPLLWQGSHPVWMDGASGLRSPCPPEGQPLEALARRLRALLQPQSDG